MHFPRFAFTKAAAELLLPNVPVNNNNIITAQHKQA